MAPFRRRCRPYARLTRPVRHCYANSSWSGCGGGGVSRPAVRADGAGGGHARAELASVQEQLSSRAGRIGRAAHVALHEARRASSGAGLCDSGAIAALVLGAALLADPALGRGAPGSGPSRRTGGVEAGAERGAGPVRGVATGRAGRGGAPERLKALIAHSFEVVAIASRQDNYIYVSPASREIYGLTEKELIGKSVYEGSTGGPDQGAGYFTLAERIADGPDDYLPGDGRVRSGTWWNRTRPTSGLTRRCAAWC